MNIDVAEFLNNASITQIRKLLKLIDNGENPRQIEVLENYIAEWKLWYESAQKTHANLCVEFRTKAGEFQEQVDKIRITRSQYKKGSRPWECYQSKLESVQSYMKDAKARARTHELEFAANKRTKEKFEKLLIYMQP